MISISVKNEAVKWNDFYLFFIEPKSIWHTNFTFKNQKLYRNVHPEKLRKLDRRKSGQRKAVSFLREISWGIVLTHRIGTSGLLETNFFLYETN